MSDLVIVISGGSRGLGAGIVKHLLASGHRVATFSRSSSPFIEELQSNLETNERFFYQAVDAKDTEGLRGFVHAVRDRFGTIDALINNAAVAIDGVLALTQESQIETMLDINLKATLVLTKECVRAMLLNRQGVIINVTSIIGSRGFSGLSVYATTKAGMIGMTRSLARELGRRNIRVNAVAPGYLETEMSNSLEGRQREQIIRRTPLGRLGRVEDVLPTIDFLLSPKNAYMTGQVLTIDGGSSV